jgi:hypothetical protein
MSLLSEKSTEADSELLTPFELLPLECGAEILSFLPGVDACRSLIVSQSLSAFGELPYLWASALSREYPTSAPPFPLSPSSDISAARILRASFGIAHRAAAALKSGGKDSTPYSPVFVPNTASMSRLGGREGHAVATVSGGDVLVLMGGWLYGDCKADLWVCDTNILPHEIGIELASSSSSSSNTASGDDASSPNPAQIAAARTALALRSPTRTGVNAHGPLEWSPARSIPYCYGKPSNRYGHNATTVLISSSVLADLESRLVREDSGEGVKEQPLATPTRLRTTEISQLDKLRRSFLTAAKGGVFVACEAAHAASVAVPTHEYGMAPNGMREAILIQGGMRSGGYRHETGDAWFVLAESKIEFADRSDDTDAYLRNYWSRNGDRVPLEMEGDDNEEEDESDSNEEEDESYDNEEESSNDSELDDDAESLAVVDMNVDVPVGVDVPVVGAPTSSSAKRLVHRITLRWIPIKINAPRTPNPPLLSLRSSPTTAYTPPSLSPAFDLTARGYHASVLIPSLNAVFISGGIGGGLNKRSIWALESLCLSTLSIKRWGEGEENGEIGGGGGAGSSGIATRGDIMLVGAAPIGRHGHSMTCIDNRVFVFGGATGRDILRDGIELFDCHILDIVTKSWSSPILTPEPSAGPQATLHPSFWTGRCHSATRFGNKILIIGGGADVCASIGVIDTRGIVSDDGNASITYRAISSRVRRSGRRGEIRGEWDNGDDYAVFHSGEALARYNHAAVKVGFGVHIIAGWSEGEALDSHIEVDLGAPLVDIEITNGPLAFRCRQ